MHEDDESCSAVPAGSAATSSGGEGRPAAASAATVTDGGPCSAAIARRMIGFFEGAASRVSHSVPRPDGAQRRIRDLVARGWSASRSQRSSPLIKTIRNHVSSVFRRSGRRSRANVVKTAGPGSGPRMTATPVAIPARRRGRVSDASARVVFAVIVAWEPSRCCSPRC
jgi:hypothetical protein